MKKINFRRKAGNKKTKKNNFATKDSFFETDLRYKKDRKKFQFFSKNNRPFKVLSFLEDKNDPRKRRKTKNELKAKFLLK